jgi:hypothetical protein
MPPADRRCPAMKCHRRIRYLPSRCTVTLSWAGPQGNRVAAMGATPPIAAAEPLWANAFALRKSAPRPLPPSASAAACPHPARADAALSPSVAQPRSGAAHRTVRLHQPNLLNEPARSPHQVLQLPALEDPCPRMEPVLECILADARRAWTGTASVHAAAVLPTQGRRHAGRAGAGPGAAASARVHRRGVTRALARHLCGLAAPWPARSPVGSAGLSARRRARVVKSGVPCPARFRRRRRARKARVQSSRSALNWAT